MEITVAPAPDPVIVEAGYIGSKGDEAQYVCPATGEVATVHPLHLCQYCKHTRNQRYSRRAACAGCGIIVERTLGQRTWRCWLERTTSSLVTTAADEGKLLHGSVDHGIAGYRSICAARSSKYSTSAKIYGRAASCCSVRRNVAADSGCSLRSASKCSRDDAGRKSEPCYACADCLKW